MYGDAQFIICNSGDIILAVPAILRTSTNNGLTLLLGDVTAIQHKIEMINSMRWPRVQITVGLV